MDLQKLYDTNMDFRLYVSAWCKKEGINPQEAFKMNIVQEYAKYVVAKEKDNA